MLQCVLYIFLGGTTMLGTGCIPYQGAYYADKIEYVNQYAPLGYVRYEHQLNSYYQPYNYWYSYNGSYYYPRQPRYRRYRTYRPKHSVNFRPYRYKKRYATRPIIKITPAPHPRQKSHKKGKKKWKKH